MKKKSAQTQYRTKHADGHEEVNTKTNITNKMKRPGRIKKVAEQDNDRIKTCIVMMRKKLTLEII